jgi:hypothetical protein
MNQNRNDNETRFSILVDKKHKTYYCIDSNGRSYIKKDNSIEERKRT